MSSQDLEKQKFSTSNEPIQTGSYQTGHMLVKLMLLIILSIAIFLFWSTIEQLFQNILQFTLQLIGVPASSFFARGVDINATSAFMLFLIVITLIGSVLLQQRAQGFFQAFIYSLFTILVIYIIFLYYGPEFFDDQIISIVGSSFFMIVIAVVIIFYGAVFTAAPSQVPSKEAKILEYSLIGIFLLTISLFLISSTAAALDFKDSVDDGVSDVQQSSNSLTNYFQCQVLAGEIRGSSACVNATEEKRVERVSENEILTFRFKSDTFSSLVDDNFKSSQFTFNIDPPLNRNAKLLKYECRVGDNITSYEIPERYQQLTQNFPSRPFQIRLDCPVADVVDKTKSEENVKIRIYFEVKDRIIQNVPYVDCSNEYFTQNEDDFISCTSIVENYYNSQRNNNPDPLLDELFSTFNDDVRGSSTAQTTIKALRGYLPLKLNNNDFDSLNTFRYEVQFEEDRNLDIDSIQINQIETPAYISVNSQGSIYEPINFSDTNQKKLVPITFDINSFSANQIGSVEAMTIEYTINHYVEEQQRVQLRLEPDPEPEEENSSNTQEIDEETEQSDIKTQDTTSQNSSQTQEDSSTVQQTSINDSQSSDQNQG